MTKKLKVYNQKGEAVKEINTPDCFNAKINQDLVSQYVRYLLSKNREAIANTKDRGDVSGGGRKPWRQKGTGNARAGSNRSPIWIGGGVTFGPTSDKNYQKRINTKERKQALLMILASKIENLVVVDKFNFKEIKTKLAVEALNKLPVEDGQIMIFLSSKNPTDYLPFRNLPFVSVAKPGNLNALEIMRSDQLILEEEALDQLSKIYSNE